MAYPPTLPPANRTDSTISAGNHAADHNMIRAALADLLAELGATPSGVYANLTERLLGISAGQDNEAISAFLEAVASASASATVAQAAANAASAIAVGNVDVALSTLIGDDTTATGSRLNTTYGSKAAAVAGFLAPTFSTPVATTVIPVGVLADGVLYGCTGTTLKSSTDQGATWTTIRTDLPAGEFITIKDTTDGEVLIVFGSMIYRTTGWAAGKATATLTGVRAANGVASFYQWGVDTNPATGLCVATNYQGNEPFNDSRYAWKSTDGGLTWAVMYDKEAHLGLVPGATAADSHMHTCIIDPWADDRIWLVWHRSGVVGGGNVLYSDDGGTTWVKIASQQPTAAIAVKGGVVFSTDEVPNGAYVVSRTEDPAAMEYRFAWRWNAPSTGTAGFGQWATRSPDGERAYIGYIGDIGFRPVIIQSDGVGVSLAYRAAGPVTSVLGDGFRRVLYQGGHIIGAYRDTGAWTQTVAKATRARVPEVAPSADPGWVLGGVSNGVRSVAIGRSSTTAARSVAAGDGALAASTDTVAVGDASAASASEATAVGAGATAGQRCVSVGSDATAAGPDATAVGEGATTGATALSVAVGSTASTVGSRGTALGYGATAGQRCVSVGSDATAAGPDATASGDGATATAARSVALGSSAVASSTDTVAVGDASAASASEATALGASAVAASTSATAVGCDADATQPAATALGHAANAAGANATALGDAASVTGSNGTAVGQGASALANSVAVGQGAVADASCVVVGKGADSTADLSTVVGHMAKGGGAYSTVFGETAQVAGTTQFGTAIGRAATVASGHVRSVALGSTTTTTAADQVQIGGRHIELTELATDPAAPATDGARLFTKDNGAGKSQLCVRFNTGAVQVLATQP